MVVYVADDSTVADTVTPVRAEYGSGQRLACAARVLLCVAMRLSMKSTIRRAVCLSNLRNCFLAVSV